MNKTNIKLAFLLLLGIGFQANSMKNEDFPEINCDGIDESAEEIVEILEKIEKDEKEREEERKKQLNEWKQGKKLINDELNEKFAKLINAISYCTNYDRKLEQYIVHFPKKLDLTVNDTLLKLQELVSCGLDISSIFDKYGASYTSAAIVSCPSYVPTKFIKILINSGAYFCNWHQYSPLGTLATHVYGGGMTELEREKFVKFLLAHNYSLLPSELKDNNNILISNAYHIDQLKNWPELLAQKLVEFDEKYLMQRALMRIYKEEKFKNFTKQLKKAVEKQKEINMSYDEFQRYLIRFCTTSRIMYHLMENSVVPITEERIMAQPAKKRQLELQDVVDQNKMIKFNEKFDAKLNYKN